MHFIVVFTCRAGGFNQKLYGIYRSPLSVLVLIHGVWLSKVRFRAAKLSDSKATNVCKFVLGFNFGLCSFRFVNV